MARAELIETIAEPLQIDGGGKGWNIPKGLDARMTAFLQRITRLQPIRDSELRRIRDHYEGGLPALSNRYFPAPPQVDPKEWDAVKTLFVHCNLVRPSVRCWTSALYGGDVVRRVIANPHNDVIEPWLASAEYGQLVEQWCESAVLYGTAALVPEWDEEAQELVVWTPDPLHTYIETSPLNVRETWGVIEVHKDFIRWVTRESSGYLTKSGDYSATANNYASYLPVAIAYGVDRRNRGEADGLSLVGDSVSWTIAATDVVFNARMLQKTATRALLVFKGEDDKVDVSTTNWNRYVRTKGDASYASPDQDPIRATLELLSKFLGLLATSSSIPHDVLDATLTESVASAEAARIRAIPLVQRARQLVPVWRSYEQELVLAATGAIEHALLQGQPVNRANLRKRVQTDIQITPNILPQSPNELTQDLIAKVAAGLVTPEDAVRVCNPCKSESELAEMAAEIRKRQEAQGAKAVEQHALKESAEAQDPGQEEPPQPTI